MARLTDDELLSICESEIASASGTTHGELADERAKAMEYYLGEPFGDEKEGRSQVVLTDVRDTVEAMMPQLMRIFADAENLVEFDPVGPEDEEPAQQESDRVNHAFWKDNSGFTNLYVFCKDALLSKTGNLKVWWEEEQTEREEYKGLTDVELAQLLDDTSYDRKIVEYEPTEDGHHIVFLTVKSGGRVNIEPVTPEEFGVASDSRSPYPEDSRFVWQKVKKSYSDLLDDGYDKKTLERLPSNENAETQETLSRRHLSDETESMYSSSHLRMQTYWITECYLRIDRDDDGVPELLKVTLATGAYASTGATLLDVEEVDAMPFFTASPILLTHKFHGLSIADLVMDLQRIKSTILRQILDNAYLANNQQKAANERVNLDDLLTSRPGGVVRIDGEGDIGGSLMPIVSTPLPAETFGLMQYFDSVRKDRTGSSEEVPGLDTKSLANINSGVAAIVYDQARARVELIARILAEVALKPLMRRIHTLLQKNQSKEEVVKLRGQWVPVNPSEWKERKNMTVQVGLGISSRERRLVALDAIAERQSQIVAGGGMGTLLMPEHLYAQLHDHAEALGMEPSKFYQDPRELPPKQPEGPSAQDQAMILTAQAQMGAAQAQNDKNKVEMAKAQADVQIRQMELAASQRELELKRQTEALKGDLAELKSQRETAEKNSKVMIEAEIKTREHEIKLNDQRLRDSQEAAKREVDMYKAVLASGTQLTIEQMKAMGMDVPQEEKPDISALVNESVSALVAPLQAELLEEKMRREEVEKRAREPKAVKRDAQGLIVAIGDIPVVRDESGMVQSIG